MANVARIENAPRLEKGRISFAGTSAIDATYIPQGSNGMAAFFLWCILFVLCWPLAILALILYPLVWLLLLPFRIVGIAVEGVLALVWAVVMLPFRLLTAPFRLV
jgi:hypothetical protein